MVGDSSRVDQPSKKELKRHWNLDCDIVYGPISSRRFGYSLGVNLLPSGQKVCNFDCLYCQCGWTPRFLAKQGFTGVAYPSLAEIERDIDVRFKGLREQGNLPHTVVFSGNGEPTLHPDFAKAVAVVERYCDQYLPEAQVGILTNGSQLRDSVVFQAVCALDLKSVKFDAGGEWLDRPLAHYDLGELIPVWRELPNLTIQSFFCEGQFDNTVPLHVDPWLERLVQIQPRRLQIYTLDRVPPVPVIHKASSQTLGTIADKVKQRLQCAVEIYE
jgi:wyosine [tRNA(Phe)-imidazoG37] synthetase (radical SAM superfamily)